MFTKLIVSLTLMFLYGGLPNQFFRQINKAVKTADLDKAGRAARVTP